MIETESPIDKLCRQLQAEELRHRKAMARIRRDAIIFKICLMITVALSLASVFLPLFRHLTPYHK